MQVETSTLADRVIWWVLRNFSDTHISRAFLSWERLFGYWLVSPTLFNEEETFPYLREVQIQGVFIIHDNLWYFTGNSTDVEASYQHSRHEGMMRMMEIPRLELFLQSRIPGSLPEVMNRTICGEHSQIRGFSIRL